MNKPISKQYRRPAPYKVPSVKKMEELIEKRKYSPDIAQLEQFEHQLVFVCDELMPLHRNHGLVEGYTDTWTAFTLNPYTMFKKKLGEQSWPVVLDKKFSQVPFTHVKGELYALRPGRFKELDTYYKNGVDIVRRRVMLLVPYLYRNTQEARLVAGEEILPAWTYKMHIVRAWMYLAIPEMWMHIIDSGYLFSPVKTFSPNSKLHFLSYYYWTSMEYKS